MEKTKQKLPGVAIALIIFLVIRALGQLLAAGVGGGVGTMIYLLLAAVYIAAIYGTVKREKWAPMLVVVVAVVDVVAALVILNGVGAFGALIMDMLLIVLALNDKKHIEGKGKKKAS